MWIVAADYPADAAGGGGDFFSLAARRNIVDTDGDGTEILRPEKVLVSERELNGEWYRGRVCISENTVRYLGSLVGLITPAALHAVERELVTTRHQLDQSEGARMDLLATLRTMNDTELVRAIYVAADGTEHPSRSALDAHMNPRPPTDGQSVAAPFMEATP